MLSPGAAIGRYVIHKKLAEGGMAEVYLAAATGPEGFAKEVVIKVVRGFLASDQQFIDMFVAEARLSSRLNHANVVQIFDFGKADDSYYLAMEYVRGASLWDLRKRCRERGVPFPPTLAAEIGSQVARGLQYAHALADRGTPLGIVHRDVTPHNVLLSFDGAIKLTDFGIAKAGTTQTAPGILKGKFAYMSPEQARGEVVDARSDVFAMGIVMWELLTGGRLFDGDSEMAVLRAVQESVIPPPGRLNPDVPDDLSEIVLKALSRPLETRFQTAFELERALANFVLRQAKTVEDTSASLFLQQLFREEYEAVNQAHGGFDEAAHGATLSVKRNHGPPEGEIRSAHANEPTQPPRSLGSIDTGAAARPTDQMPGVVIERPKTDVMPALRSSRQPPTIDESADAPRSPSRRLPPLVDDERPPEERTPPQRSPSRKLPPLGDERPSSRKLPPVDDTPAQRPPSRKLPTLAGERPPSRKLPPLGERPTSPVQQALGPEEPSVPRSPAQTLPPDEDEVLQSPPTRVSFGALVGAFIVLALAAGGVSWFVSSGGLASRPLEAAPVAAAPEPVEVPAAVVAPAAVIAPAMAEPAAAIDAGAEPIEVVTAKPVVVVDAGAPAPRAAPAVAVAISMLEVKAVPYALLSIDGRAPLEIEGSRSLRLTVGPHELVFKHPLQTKKEHVVMKAGQTASISFDATH